MARDHASVPLARMHRIIKGRERGCERLHDDRDQSIPIANPGVLADASAAARVAPTTQSPTPTKAPK